MFLREFSQSDWFLSLRVEIIDNHSVEKIQSKEGTESNEEAEVSRPVGFGASYKDLFLTRTSSSPVHDVKPPLSKSDLKHGHHCKTDIIKVRVQSDPVTTPIHTVYVVNQRVLDIFRDIIHDALPVTSLEVRDTKDTEEEEEHQDENN